jgi:hypothetical protein
MRDPNTDEIRAAFRLTLLLNQRATTNLAKWMLSLRANPGVPFNVMQELAAADELIVKVFNGPPTNGDAFHDLADTYEKPSAEIVQFPQR